MNTGYSMPVEEDRDDRVALSKVVRRASVFDRRQRQPKARSVLGEPSISKRQTRKRNVQRQRPKAPDAASEPAPPAMNLSSSTSNISRISDRPKIKPRRTKTRTPLRQLRPQKVFKAKRFNDANAKSAAASRRRAVGQKRPLNAQSPRRPHPALRVITTRTGRVSRPPVKWVPE